MYTEEAKKFHRGIKVTHTPKQQMKKDQYMFVRRVYRGRSSDPNMAAMVKIHFNIIVHNNKSQKIQFSVFIATLIYLFKARNI